MLFRAESIKRRIVFTPARRETRSPAVKLSKRVLPSFVEEISRVRRVPSIASGASETAIAETILTSSLL